MSTEEQLGLLREHLAQQKKALLAEMTDDKRADEAPPKPKAETPPPPKPEPVKAPPHAPLPLGTQSLLDAQLGEALKIMRDYADWVHHPHSAIEECMHVGNALAHLMTASSTLATVAARLQAGEPESRHRMIVEYAEPAPLLGEGSAKSRKRINRDKS